MALALAFVGLLLPHAVRAQNVSQTAIAGPYSITLKVLPAEPFMGSMAAMARDGGAMADTMKGPGHPNHHMVAFIEEKGAPVEDASVTIRYRQLLPTRGAWMTLPVARMHMAGKGLATTHYGNNVDLSTGSYEARVTVNGKNSAHFRFSL
jgi:hypothetical protein